LPFWQNTYAVNSSGPAIALFTSTYAQFDGTIKGFSISTFSDSASSTNNSVDFYYNLNGSPATQTISLPFSSADAHSAIDNNSNTPIISGQVIDFMLEVTDYGGSPYNLVISTGLHIQI
jgi:hypothetical protein